MPRTMITIHATQKIGTERDGKSAEKDRGRSVFSAYFPPLRFSSFGLAENLNRQSWERPQRKAAVAWYSLRTSPLCGFPPSRRQKT